MNKLIEPVLTIVKNKELILELSKKEIIDKYKGQPMGLLWALIHPLLQILIYIFLFSVVYQARIGGENQSSLSYAAYLLSGCVPWLTIQAALNGGAISITSNSTLIKQVIFPAEVLPIKMVGSAVIIEVIYLVIDIVYCVLATHTISLTYLLLPIALAIEIVFLIGANYAVSALNVYMRDVKDIVQVICMIGVYLLPVIYSPVSVPAMFRPFLYLNPISHIIWMFQDIMYFGDITHWYSWLISFAEAVILFYAGNSLFQKLKIGFGSVL